MTTTLPLGCLHTAHLDPMTGTGLLEGPHPADDLWLGVVSLHAAAWDHAMRLLYGMGWVPLEDDAGDLIEEGATSQGRPLWAIATLDGESIISHPSIDDLIAARSRLVACLP